MTENRKKLDVGRMENRNMVGDLLDGDPFNVVKGFTAVVKKVAQHDIRIHEHSDAWCSLQEQLDDLKSQLTSAPVEKRVECEETCLHQYVDPSLLNSVQKQEFALSMTEEFWEKLEQFCDEVEIRMVVSNLQKRLIDFHMKAKVHAKSRETQDHSE